MISLNDKKDCCGCASCVNACPKHCITMKSDYEGFMYPETDVNLCIDCNLCNKSCPVFSIVKSGDIPYVYGCYNKDDNIRLRSSSGGIFHLLCQYIIENNGAVFGAAFDNNFNVYHDFAESMEDCEKFKGSKYVQSIIGDSYSNAKKFLDKGRLVLFTGTPCQIAGLQTFLKKDYDNLYTQDIACHSVPSPKVWNDYKEIISSGSTIKKIEFRNKENGWNNGYFKVQLNNSNSLSEPYIHNAFMRGFLNGLYSRPSCYDCKFSNLKRCSDITLADFWGIEAFYPQLFDNKGTSLVFVNSEKGRCLFNYAKKRLKYKKVKIEKAIWYNPALHNSIMLNSNREKFFENTKDSVLEKIRIYYNDMPNETKQYISSIFDKIKFKIYNFLNCGKRF